MVNVLPFTTSTRLSAAVRSGAVEASCAFGLPLGFTAPPRTAWPFVGLIVTAMAVAPDVTDASVTVAPPVSVRPPTCTARPEDGLIVSTAAGPLAVMTGASAPGSARIVVAPVTASVFAPAAHAAAEPGESQPGIGGARPVSAGPVTTGTPAIRGDPRG